MDDKTLENSIENPDLSDDEQFSVESILAEYKVRADIDAAESAPESDEEIPSPHIVMEDDGDQLAAFEFSDGEVSDIPEADIETSDVSEAGEEIPEAPKKRFSFQFIDASEFYEKASSQDEDNVQENNDGSDISGNVADISAPEADEIAPEAVESDSKAAEEAVDAAEISDSDMPGEYASADYPPLDDTQREKLERPVRSRSLSETLLAPIIAVLSLAAVRKHQKAEERAFEPHLLEDEDAPPPPEASPKKAAKFYHRQIHSLRLRSRIAAALCCVLVYISYAPALSIPLPGVFAKSAPAAALCLVFELLVMLCGVDVFTGGLLSLFEGRPRAESLVSVSCIFSVLDAVLSAFGVLPDRGLPYCAVSALSMAFALRGARLTCSALSLSMRTAAASKAPFTVTSEKTVVGKASALLKSQRGIDGFVRRCEAPDLSEQIYALFAPFFLIASLIFALLATVLNKTAADFVHALSALTAVTASFSSLLCFPQPFCTAARQLQQNGAAVAGSAGCEDIDRAKRVIITDTDLFPPGTVSISGIRILEGTFTDKVISYTGSLLAASGAGMASAFTELIFKSGYTMLRVENFTVHEGGGLSATIKGEQVLVGSSGFMNLKGIRLPQKLNSRTAVFTAISGSLVGVFNLNYTPVTSVQDALVSILNSRGAPVFATRDFNITPVMIRQKFKLPTEGFDFPSFAERYRISGCRPENESQIVAVLSRQGLGPMVSASDEGRRLFRTARMCTWLSVLGSLLGMILIFILCRSGSYTSASVGNVISFMLLWLVPLIIMNHGLKR